MFEESLENAVEIAGGILGGIPEGVAGGVPKEVPGGMPLELPSKTLSENHPGISAKNFRHEFLQGFL